MSLLWTDEGGIRVEFERDFDLQFILFLLLHFFD